MVEQLRKVVRKKGVLTLPDAVQAGMKAGTPAMQKKRGKRSLHDTFWTPFGSR